jgi:hypothetical protein
MVTINDQVQCVYSVGLTASHEGCFGRSASGGVAMVGRSGEGVTALHEAHGALVEHGERASDQVYSFFHRGVEMDVWA